MARHAFEPDPMYPHRCRICHGPAGAHRIEQVTFAGLEPAQETLALP